MSFPILPLCGAGPRLTSDACTFFTERQPQLRTELSHDYSWRCAAVHVFNALTRCYETSLRSSKLWKFIIQRVCSLSTAESLRWLDLTTIISRYTTRHCSTEHKFDYSLQTKWVKRKGIVVVRTCCAWSKGWDHLNGNFGLSDWFSENKTNRFRRLLNEWLCKLLKYKIKSNK